MPAAVVHLRTGHHYASIQECLLQSAAVHTLEVEIHCMVEEQVEYLEHRSQRASAELVRQWQRAAYLERGQQQAAKLPLAH